MEDPEVFRNMQVGPNVAKYYMKGGKIIKKELPSSKKAPPTTSIYGEGSR